MEYGKVEQLRDEVIGLRPVYSENGNATELLLKNGEVVLDKRSLNSTGKALAASYAIDRKAQRRQLQAILNRKGGACPFYLPRGRVFIPLKLRRAVIDKDAVYGYIDLAYMGEPKPISSRECAVELSNGLRLAVSSSRNTVLGAQHDGIAVLDFLHTQNEKGDEIGVKQIMAAIRVLINAIGQNSSGCQQ